MFRAEWRCAATAMSSSLLREEDSQELRSIFDAFDHNSDGLLDVDEVAGILHMFGKPMTEAEVRPSLRPAPGPPRGSAQSRWRARWLAGA